MGLDTILTALNQQVAHVVKGANADTINEQNSLTLKMIAPLEQYAAVVARNAANQSLSPQGAQEANRTSATNTTAPAFKFITTNINTKQAANQRLHTQFSTVDPGLKDSDRILTFVYLWDKYDSLDLAARVTQFSLAAEQDQVVVLSAMLTHPEGPMVPEDVRDAALTERAKRLFPQQYTSYEQNQLLIDFLTMYRDWIARWLAVEVGVPLDVIRTNFGDDIANALTTQVTGVPAAK